MNAIRFDLHTGAISNGARRLFPGSQEHELLTLLLAARAPIAPHDLRRALWGPHPPAGWEITLPSVVSHLRSFLAGSGYRIQCWQGIGYRLERRPGMLN